MKLPLKGVHFIMQIQDVYGFLIHATAKTGPHCNQTTTGSTSFQIIKESSKSIHSVESSEVII